ncbi:MAG: MFS transporter, partial [Ginsengibacter sp.]
HFFNPSNIPSLTSDAEAKANEYVHLFATLAYFMPLVGGIAADWFFGKYKVILYVSILYALGNLTLALSTNNLGGFLTGLIMIAVAAGGIKSCVSANVGDQFDKTNQHLLSKVYGWFYFAINTGGTISPILIPIIYNKYKDSNPGIAFGVPGIIMVVATVIFWLGRKKYVRVPPTGIKKENFVAITYYAITKLFNKRPGQTVWQAVEEKYSPKSVDGVRAVYRILIVFAFTIIYWAMWDQNLSEWILQAKKMDLHVNLHWKQFDLLAEQINAMNPIFVLILIPVFTYGVYPLFQKMGIKPTPLRKIGAGLVLIGFSFVVIALVQKNIDQGGKPPIIWQILAYFILAASEVLVSITCLEYA